MDIDKFKLWPLPVSDKETFTSAAKRKATIVNSPFEPHNRIGKATFEDVDYKMMRLIHDPEFWQKGEDFCEEVFANYCRVYVLCNADTEEDERIMARWFARTNELFTIRLLRKSKEGLDAYMVREGYEYKGRKDGIEQWEKPRKSPSPRKVK